MAAIEQIIQIAVNERTAEQGVSDASAAQMTATSAATAASNAATAAGNAATAAGNAQTTANTAETRANASVAYDDITTSAGSGLTISGAGNSRTYSFGRPTVLNTSDVHTFATPSARNAASTIEWHIGDIAVVTTGGVVGGAFAPTAGNYSYNRFNSATSFTIFNAYDIANDQLNTDLGFDVGDTIQFRNADNRLAGSVSGGTEFVVNNIERDDPTSTTNANIIVTLDRSTLPSAINPPSEVGSVILVTSATTVVSGSYVYNGSTSMDDHTGVTVSSDWTLLNAPGDVASNAALATFQLGSGDPSRLSTVVYDSGAMTLTINGTSVEVGGGAGGSIERNFYRYSGPAIQIEGLPSEQADGTPIDPTTQQAQAIPVAVGTTNWTSSYGPTAVPTTNWPQNASVFALGDKLLYGASPNGDWVFTDTGGTMRTGFTISISVAQRRILGGEYDNAGTFTANTQPLRLEVETLVIPTTP